jgi:hypothetical protein|mmetsp:Transcript_22974/g.30567  ORF Transcript_22974/g.30567 Transcript_22974/m.30567 type:complete len:113 (+) Transcript_22974:1953-2291(+)
MMMDAQGTGRFYHLEPEQHQALVQQNVEKGEFLTTVHLKFEEGFIDGKEATEISKLFEGYGDFFLHKDTASSAYLEFFFIDPLVVPSQTVNDLIANLVGRQDLQIVHAFNHK